MNKYRKLAFNTVIFAIGNFSSKIFSLLLNNLYTKHISPSGFYSKTLLETIALFMLPVFTFSLTEAIVRYGLDKRYDNKQVFTTASVLTLSGLTAMIFIAPMLQFIPLLRPIRGYMILLIIYIFTSALRALCSQFVRSRDMVKLFSFDGILTTFTLLIFNLIFISGMGLGVKGFMLSTILSDALSAVFLFTVAGLKNYFSINSFSKKLGKSMLRFTLPLVPTTVMWTFTGFSDQLFIGNMHRDGVFLGENAAGVYAAATKVPNLISMLSTIFFQAWNMSAIMENDSKDRDLFYEKVYSAYEAILFIGSAGLIILLKPISAILINYNSFPEYSDAYLYTPLLIAAAVFTCFDLFLASIYTATKHTKNAFWTIFAVCIVNIILNYFLIPCWGIQGAALATFISYLLCYCIRMIDARYYVPFGFSPVRITVNTSLLLAMCAFMIFQPVLYMLWLVMLAAAVCVFNFFPLTVTVKKILKK
ncbi:MAG: polysaccharide biosynthesis C-terminal domain-containing protein [Ruminococcus sp.]|nr:polysaccharide biosynthesis C-terminal domain-containing protein [Ruminococcus sp.]